MKLVPMEIVMVSFSVNQHFFLYTINEKQTHQHFLTSLGTSLTVVLQQGDVHSMITP